MIYPENYSYKTGFEQIRQLTGHFCLSEMGRERLSRMSFSSDFALITRQITETREFLTILETGMPFPTQDYFDLSPALNRIKRPGSYFLPEEMHDLRQSLATIAACLNFFRLPSSQSFTFLIAKAGDLSVPKQVLAETDRIIDEKGRIRDSASPELNRIRREIDRKTVESEKIIGRMLIAAREAGWTSKDAEVTLSEGRLVIPMLATHKRKIKGIIHDESASGQTVYLEPETCLEINNEIRRLEGAEKREIISILTQFADFVRPETDELLAAYALLGELDFIRAKARFAQETGSDKPLLSPEPAFNWMNARHPLLYLSFKQKHKTVVPLNFRLDREERILIITGPNAGGKSVCLKTIGLIQYMIQCGMLAPLSPDSQAGIFERIFIDIGDEQSLENDLSTYSSHLLNLNFFMENCNHQSLFLVDELGTGTDPSLGGAIAEASLEKLSQTGAFGIVTTHYSNLKLLAGRIPGIVNGAMLFDTKKLQPLFILATGKPGSSFTFEIARRIGFPEDVIDHAIIKAGKTHLDFERQLQDVEAEKLRLEKKLEEFQVADRFLGEMIEKYEMMKSDLERTRKEILEKAKNDARDILSQSNRMIENTIREIREAQAEKEATKNARIGLEKFRQKLEKDKEPENVVETTAKAATGLKKELRAGDMVTIGDKPGTGVIVRIKEGKALLDFSGIRMTVNIHQLKPARKSEQQLSGKVSSFIRDINEKAVNFKLVLDLRGKMADEALQLLQRYIDDAYLLRMKEVSILHGKGEGVLRQVVRNYLSGCDEIISFGDEDADRGGAGITKVSLK